MKDRVEPTLKPNNNEDMSPFRETYPKVERKTPLQMK